MYRFIKYNENCVLLISINIYGYKFIYCNYKYNFKKYLKRLKKNVRLAFTDFRAMKLPFTEIPMVKREICVQSAFPVFPEETCNS